MSLYPVGNADIRAATAMLARAFHDDPLWVHVFPDVTRRATMLPRVFEVSLRLAILHGEVIASSPALEGIAAWQPGEHARFTMGDMFRSGAIKAAMKVGFRAGHVMQRLTASVEHYRHTCVPRPFLYLAGLGVDPAHQGKGIATMLLQDMFQRTDTRAMHVYLETEVEDNLRFYKKHGFTVMDTISSPGSPVTFWCLLREPNR